MDAGDDALTAAIAAGYTRLRPVLMTAGAMILGMIPMALGVGEGGEQNAPLARAVIGGLLFATFATLIFVPAMYRLLRGAAQRPRAAPGCPGRRRRSENTGSGIRTRDSDPIAGPEPAAHVEPTTDNPNPMSPDDGRLPAAADGGPDEDAGGPDRAGLAGGDGHGADRSRTPAARTCPSDYSRRHRRAGRALRRGGGPRPGGGRGPRPVVARHAEASLAARPARTQADAAAAGGRRPRPPRLGRDLADAARRGQGVLRDHASSPAPAATWTSGSWTSATASSRARCWRRSRRRSWTPSSRRPGQAWTRSRARSTSPRRPPTSPRSATTGGRPPPRAGRSRSRSATRRSRRWTRATPSSRPPKPRSPWARPTCSG